jgi:hypothetical protein
MDNRQIESFLRQTECRRYKIFVTASDLLPRQKEFPYLIVSNTDRATEPGTHWVVFYIPKISDGVKEVWYFDPLGVCSLEHGQFKQFINEFDLLLHNKGFPVQHNKIFSDTCGLICCFFAHLVCEGWEFEDVMKLFDVSGDVKATEKNECLILYYMMEKYVKHASIFKKLVGCRTGDEQN